MSENENTEDPKNMATEEPELDDAPDAVKSSHADVKYEPAEIDETFKIGEGVYHTEHTSLKDRVIDAWSDMRGSTRRMIEECPSEARLLFFVLISDLIFMLSWSIKTVVSPTEALASALPRDAVFWLVGALLLRTAAIYIFSIVVGFALRLFGGKGTLKDTRVGMFWGSFVAAPFGLLAAIITYLMSLLEVYLPFLKGGMVSLVPLWIGLLPFVWFVSAGATEAHQFKKVFPLFAALSLLCVVGLILAMYLRAQGVL